MPKPRNAPAYTINRLSELTGADRRTLSKRLRDVEPVRVTNGAKYYTLEMALEAAPDANRPKAKPAPSQAASRHRDHYLYDFILAAIHAGHWLHKTKDAYMAMMDKIGDIARTGSEAAKELVEYEMNVVSPGYERPVHELLFGTGEDNLGGQIADVLIACERYNQRILDVDAALRISGTFDTKEGREMLAAVRKKRMESGNDSAHG